MADNNNTIKTTVELDANKAQQEIVKLNSKASDSTKTLEERIEAKNKQVKIQDALSKKIIKDLEDEIKRLEQMEGSEKELLKAKKKLNNEQLKAIRISTTNEKVQNKLNEALEDSKSATKQLDDATGGLITRFKTLATNPIVLVLAVLAGLFKGLQKAINRSEKATEAFAKVGAFLEGVFNGLIAVLEPVVEFIGETLVFAIEKPGEAWNSFVGILESGYNFIKKQVIDRFSGNWKILSGLFEKGVLKMRIAWNDFTGDSEEAEQLRGELDKVNKKIQEGVELIKGANDEVVSLYNSAKEAVIEFAEQAVESYDKAAKATEALANAERRLVINRIALEKQQLTSLRLAEEQRQIRDDTSRSIEERIEANEQLGVILEEQLKRELAIARLNLDIALKKQAADGKTIESIEAIGDAEIKVLEIQERITGQRSEQIVNEIALRKEQADAQLALGQRNFDAQVKLDELEIQRKKLKGEETLQLEIDLLERIRDQQLMNEELTKLEILAIEEKFKEDKLALEKAADEAEFNRLRERNEVLLELDQLEIDRLKFKGEKTLALELELLEKKRIQDVSAAGLSAKQIQAINEEAELAKAQLRREAEAAEKAKEAAVLQNALDGAAAAFGIAQEVAVAKMIIAAPEAISGSFKEAAKNYAPPLSLVMGALGAAGTVAPIIKGLADIKKVRFSKKSSGASPSGSISASVGGGGSSATSGVAASNITSEVVNDIASNNAARLGIDTNLGSAASSDASNNVLGSTSNNLVFSESKYSDFQNQVEFKEDKITI